MFKFLTLAYLNFLYLSTKKQAIWQGWTDTSGKAERTPSAGLICKRPGFMVIFNQMSKAKTFQVDQKVVYPSQGVGVIKSIIQKKFKDSKIPYYVIYLEVTDMTIMVPIDKAVELGIRPTVSRDEAAKALELMSEDYEPIPSDWKMRYQMNLDLLKKGSVRDIASIVRSLYHRSKVKELPIQERKLYDSALKLLEDEISISLRKSREEVEGMIFSRLELE
jgi:CarD family transcriptional regulator